MISLKPDLLRHRLKPEFRVFLFLSSLYYDMIYCYHNCYGVTSSGDIITSGTVRFGPSFLA